MRARKGGWEGAEAGARQEREAGRRGGAREAGGGDPRGRGPAEGPP